MGSHTRRVRPTRIWSWPVKGTCTSTPHIGTQIEFVDVAMSGRVTFGRGTMWRTQRSGTAGRTNRGFLAQCPPNPQVYPSHKTTRLSRRSCVLPQPAQATAISGSPFLFLLTVEILICDSSHEFSNRNTLFLRNLFQRRFLVSKDRCSFVSSFV